MTKLNLFPTALYQHCQTVLIIKKKKSGSYLISGPFTKMVITQILFDQWAGHQDVDRQSTFGCCSLLWLFLCLSWDQWAFPPKVDWGVVHEIPDRHSNQIASAFHDLCDLNDFLLQRCRIPPIDH